MKKKGVIILTISIGLFIVLNARHSHASNPVDATPQSIYFQIMNNNNLIISSNEQNTTSLLDFNLFCDDDVNTFSRKKISLKNKTYCLPSTSYLVSFQKAKPNRVSNFTYFPHLSHSYFISLKVFRL
jgi:hypothetical protein